MNLPTDTRTFFWVPEIESEVKKEKKKYVKRLIFLGPKLTQDDQISLATKSKKLSRIYSSTEK